MERIKKLFPGMVFTALLAFISIFIQNINFIKKLHFSSLIIAIILGLLLKNIFKIPVLFDEGIRFSLKRILRLGVILLGFRLSFAEISLIGWKGLILVLIVTPATILFATWLGKKFGLDKNLSLLIGSGTGICGASAIAAVAPIINGDEKDSTFAIATVTIFGTIAMFLYPILFRVFHLPNLVYAVWTGSSIHEVAQVVATGFAAGDQAGQFATLIKLTRVLMVIPISIIIGIITFRKSEKGVASKKMEMSSVPWFVFGFLAIFIINSLHVVPTSTTQGFITLDSFLLTWAMAGMGLETSLEKMKQVGMKAFYVGLITWLFIGSLGFVMAELLF